MTSEKDIAPWHKYISAKYMNQSTHYVKASSEISRHLNISIVCENQNTLEVIIKDHNKSTHQIPFKEPFPHKELLNFTSSNFSHDRLPYSIDVRTEPLAIRIVRKQTNETIFDTSGENFIVSKQYLQIGTKIPTPYIFGMGERNFQYRLKNGIYTLYARDEVGDIETGETPGHNTYGVHPMYLMKEKSGNYHVVYLRSSNPMDFTIKNKSVNYKIVSVETIVY